MANSHCYLTFVLVAVITVFLHQPRFTSGLHTPLNVKARVINHTQLVIISWDYQAEANYSTIHVRTYFKKPLIAGHSIVMAGPTKPPCDSSTCSFCVGNVKYNASCSTFNPAYKFSVSTDMEFEFLFSYKVGACSSNESSSCIDSMWKNYTIPIGEFGGYTLHKKMCLDHDDYISLEEDSTVESCVKNCSDDKSCKSFEFGHGYNKKGVFQDDLFAKSVGLCKLRNENTQSYKLKSCMYNYYEKKGSSEPGTSEPGSTGVMIIPYALLLSLSVALSTMI